MLIKTFCTTKTGNKIHVRYGNSSRTLCGCKVARKVTPNLNSDFCGGCGLNGEYILAMAQACATMLSAFKG